MFYKNIHVISLDDWILQNMKNKTETGCIHVSLKKQNFISNTLIQLLLLETLFKNILSSNYSFVIK